MVNFLKSWCEEIIVSCIIIVIIEMLVPNGSLKKYIQIVAGIYIVFVILNPILNRDFINNLEFNVLETSTSQMVSENDIVKDLIEKYDVDENEIYIDNY